MAKKPLKPQTILTHIFSQQNMSNFKNSLNRLTWNDVTTHFDVDTRFKNIFLDSFCVLYNVQFTGPSSIFMETYATDMIS
jgi:hypothetical protein